MTPLRIILFFLILTPHVLHSAKNRKIDKRHKRSQSESRIADSKPGPGETTTVKESSESPPLSHDDVAELLSNNGFKVKNFTDGPPLAFMGDTAYYPSQVLANLPSIADRSNAQSKRLWIDANGKQQVWYYYDAQTRADEQVFEQAVKTWAATTCIKFIRGQRGACNENRGHGAVCVGDFGGCWSLVGNAYVTGWTRSSQKMSVQPKGCEMVAAAHEFGHALGLQHQQSRPDRALHIWVNYESLDIKLQGDRDKNVKQAWYQASMCGNDQTVDVPSPYDYMSIMQYGASDFAGEDGRMVYVARDPHHQYMMDYHRNAGIAQTHYDKLVTNVAYKCDVLWRRMCSDNGNDGSKCLNGGFFSKKCICECPDGFTGSACGSKSGSPLFPVQDRAKVMLDIKASGSFNLAGRGMNMDGANLILPAFVFYQFITVVARSGHKRERATMTVNQPFQAIVGQLGASFGQQNLMQNIAVADCQITGYFYWGDAERNQMRTECISSVYNNEVPDRRLHMRGRNRTLSMVVICSLGKLFKEPAVSMKAAELKLDVKFVTNPAMQLRTFKEAADDPGPLSDPEDEKGGLGAGAIVGIVIGVLVVLAVIGLAVAWKMGKLPKR